MDWCKTEVVVLVNRKNRKSRKQTKYFEVLEEVVDLNYDYLGYTDHHLHIAYWFESGCSFSSRNVPLTTTIVRSYSVCLGSLGRFRFRVLSGHPFGALIDGRKLAIFLFLASSLLSLSFSRN